ncbi:MAG: hypothetical protein Q8K32_28010 [Archangium sp.]|nr:hypothetical protein [Archangium sp.]
MRPFFTLVLPLIGCTALVKPVPEPRMPAEEAFRPAQEVRAPAEAPGTAAWARQFRRAFDCEWGARALVPGTDLAWQALEACVQRADFSHLPEVAANWSEELRTRPGAPTLLARLIANRGGSATEDLKLLRAQGVPIFDLRSAMVQPVAFRGQLVLFIGTPLETEGGALVLTEQRRTSTVTNIVSPQGSFIEQRTTQGSGGGDFRSSGLMGGGSGEFSGNVQAQSQRGRLESRVDHGFAETGTIVLAQLEHPDLSLSPEQPSVFLARFVGTKAPSETEFVVTEDEAGRSRQTPVVSLVAHHLVR